MRYSIFLLLLFAFTACQPKEKTTAPPEAQNPVKGDTTAVIQAQPPADTLPPVKAYENERFKEVTIKKTGDGVYHVEGKARVFEAQFSWVVDDGTAELQVGHAMADGGAPAWGKFAFDFKVAKSTRPLRLTLFEASPKDGTRTYQLIVPFPI